MTWSKTGVGTFCLYCKTASATLLRLNNSKLKQRGVNTEYCSVGGGEYLSILKVNTEVFQVNTEVFQVNIEVLSEYRSIPSEYRSIPAEVWAPTYT